MGNKMNNYRVTTLKIAKDIRKDKDTLKCQLNYYEYVQGNVSKMTGEIDKKIKMLEDQRMKIVEDFMIAPERIKEVKKYIEGLKFKMKKLSIPAKIARVMELRSKLIKMGVKP